MAPARTIDPETGERCCRACAKQADDVRAEWVLRSMEVASEVSSGASGEAARRVDTADVGPEVESVAVGAYPPVRGVRCGRLPLGAPAADLLGVPASMDSDCRSPEARYARGFVAAAFRVSRAPLREPGAEVRVPLSMLLCADASGTLAELRRRQRIFFAKLDACKVDDSALRTPSDPVSTRKGASSWGHKLDVRIHALRSGGVPLAPSHTQVIEAAGFLLRGGLLNVRGTQHQNVKQGRALLHWAWWLKR